MFDSYYICIFNIWLADTLNRNKIQMSTIRSLRFFNTTGPCDPDYHYMLPPEERLMDAQLHF